VVRADTAQEAERLEIGLVQTDDEILHSGCDERAIIVEQAARCACKAACRYLYTLRVSSVLAKHDREQNVATENASRYSNIAGPTSEALSPNTGRYGSEYGTLMTLPLAGRRAVA
jgi:hypothetical protein